jgi:hypothetical protein
MIERTHALAHTEVQFTGLTPGERAALSAMETLDAVQILLNGFAEGKQVTLEGINTCRAMINGAMENFFIFPRQQAASISRRAALQRAHLTLLAVLPPAPSRRN